MTIGNGSSFSIFRYIILISQTSLFKTKTITIEEKASIHKETTHFETMVKVRGSNFIDF